MGENKRMLEMLDDVAPPIALSELSGAARVRRYPRRRIAFGSVGVIAVVLVALWIPLVLRSRPEIGATAPGPSWAALSPLPFGGRSNHSAVWTGRELIVWGGETSNGFSSAGASWTDESEAWRIIAESPLEPRARHTAVWTGTEMLVFGGRGEGVYADGAAYDPLTDSWRELAPAPVGERSDHGAVWTGDEMIVFGGHRGATNNFFARDTAAYDPLADSWRLLPQAPLSARQNPAVAWTGEVVVVWGGANNDGFLSDGALYTPALNSWEKMASSPMDAREAAVAAWTGTEIVITAGVSGSYPFDVPSATYDPKRNTWTDIEGPAVSGWNAGVWLEGRLVLPEAAVSWDGTRWAEVPPAPERTPHAPEILSDEDRIFLIGGANSEGAPLDAFLVLRW